MMTKRDMRHLIHKLFVLILLSLTDNYALGQSSGDLYKIYSAANEAYESNDYETAFMLYTEYIHNSQNDDNEITYYLGKSYYQIGLFYVCGHYVQINIDEAISNLTTACTKYKHTEAARLLSHIFYFREYNHIDLDKSLYFLKFSAKLGNCKSNIELGQLYLSGNSKCMKDTTVYTYYSRVNNTGDTIRCRSYDLGIKPTSENLTYPFLQIDSIQGYKYYEKGVSSNFRLYDASYSLNALDFARAYMDGTFFPRNYKQAMEYLRQSEEELQKTTVSAIIDGEFYFRQVDNEMLDMNEFSSILGEIYWRMQTCYRFGLGTRANVKKADIYLKKSAELGYQKAINAMEFK